MPDVVLPHRMILEDEDALRAHLDGLNESGVHPVAVGVDNGGQPFLITLTGPYAEHEDVFFDSPWQGEVARDGPYRCDECSGMEPDDMEHLKFPVVIMGPVTQS
jgi:hypothetical protein